MSDVSKMLFRPTALPPHGSFFASGYVGQMIMCVPALDLVIVRNGNTPAARSLVMPALLQAAPTLLRR